jgi:hypothetical protein
LVGQNWEDTLAFQAERERIILVKQWPEVLFLGPGQYRVVSKAWVDYMGAMSGIAFTMEAKATENKTKLKAPKDRMHQFFTMRGVSDRIPAFYLVYWKVDETVEVFLIEPDSPWPFWMKRGEGLTSIDLDLDRHWLGELIWPVFGEYGLDGYID